MGIRRCRCGMFRVIYSRTCGAGAGKNNGMAGLFFIKQFSFLLVCEMFSLE
jgi:hypothetical protein